MGIVEMVVALDAVERVGNLKSCPSGAANPQRVPLINRIFQRKRRRPDRPY
jgi:hypothetical protein